MRVLMKEGGVYHCISRVAGGARLLEAREKEVLRRMLRRVAVFSGVEVLAYCLMSNHLHILVRIPPSESVVSRGELLRRYRALYPEGALTTMPDADALETMLKDETSEEARFWREKLVRRMHDVSEFMRTLNQRFSLWYNHNHKRFGTFWAERFKSVLVEDDPTALKVVAAYIDLNPVRAGLVTDPGDYRWSSYGEATGGESRAQEGLAAVVGQRDWSEAAADYRMVLFGKGGQGRVGEQGAIPHERVMEVLSAGGKVSTEHLLRCRLRYMSDGAILGSEEFVRRVGEGIGRRSNSKAKASRTHALGRLPLLGSAAITTWRRLQVRAIQ